MIPKKRIRRWENAPVIDEVGGPESTYYIQTYKEIFDVDGNVVDTIPLGFQPLYGVTKESMLADKQDELEAHNKRTVEIQNELDEIKALT